MKTDLFAKQILSEVDKKGYSMYLGHSMSFITGNKQPSDIARQVCKKTGLEYDCYINEDGSGEYLFRRNNDSTLINAIYLLKNEHKKLFSDYSKTENELRKAKNELKIIYIIFIINILITIYFGL